MEAPAADASSRRGLVGATARRSFTQAEAERRLCRNGVIAVLLGTCPVLELVDVKRGMAIWFKVNEDAIKASIRVTGEYFLVLDDAQVRHEALRIQGLLHLGRVSFSQSPWSRFRRATVAKMRYKVHVCLEGVPEHGWDVETVTPLFDRSNIIEGMDPEDETGCLRLWVWMDDVTTLRTRGQLQMEEPREVDSPNMDYPELGMFEEVPPRHNVLIHLDRVVDFSPRPDSSSGSHDSGGSDISGLPLMCPLSRLGQ
uniref:DUF4283 domain-containing protein n=1 Tax=Aegilops tauschii TaxID=37682 RepID=M8CBT4_AEGTA